VAPEVQEGKPYRGDKVDIYSLGVCLFLMHMCEAPFENLNFYKWLWNSPSKFWARFKKQPSNEFKDLIQGMLCYEPRERPSLKQIFNHQWIQKFNQASTDDNIQTVH